MADPAETQWEDVEWEDADAPAPVRQPDSRLPEQSFAERWIPGQEAVYLAKLTPEQRAQFIRDGMEGRNQTAADFLLGLVRGGTLEAAPAISRASARAQGISDPSSMYDEAEKRSPWATAAGRIIGSLPAAALVTPAATTLGGVLTAGAGGAALGGIQGFLGSDVGRGTVDEWSPDNIGGKAVDAVSQMPFGAIGAMGGAIAPEVAQRAWSALKGAKELPGKGWDALKVALGGTNDDVAAAAAPEVASRADDFAAQMAPEPSPASPPDNVIPINRGADQWDVDTKQLPLLKRLAMDEEGSAKLGGMSSGPTYKSKGKAWSQIEDASGDIRDYASGDIRDYASAKFKDFEDIERLVGRPVRNAKDAFNALVAYSEAKRGKFNRRVHDWEDVQTAIRELSKLDGMQTLRMPPEIQEKIVERGAAAKEAELAAEAAPMWRDSEVSFDPVKIEKQANDAALREIAAEAKKRRPGGHVWSTPENRNVSESVKESLMKNNGMEEEQAARLADMNIAHKAQYKGPTGRAKDKPRIVPLDPDAPPPFDGDAWPNPDEWPVDPILGKRYRPGGEDDPHLRRVSYLDEPPEGYRYESDLSRQFFDAMERDRVPMSAKQPAAVEQAAAQAFEGPPTGQGNADLYQPNGASADPEWNVKTQRTSAADWWDQQERMGLRRNDAPMTDDILAEVQRRAEAAGKPQMLDELLGDPSSAGAAQDQLLLERGIPQPQSEIFAVNPNATRPEGAGVKPRGKYDPITIPSADAPLPEPTRPPMTNREPIDITQIFNRRSEQRGARPPMTQREPIDIGVTSDRAAQQAQAVTPWDDEAIEAARARGLDTLRKAGSVMAQVSGAIGGFQTGGAMGALGGWTAGALGGKKAVDGVDWAMRKFSYDPAKLKAAAASGGPLAGPARFILEGAKDGGEAGIKARAAIAAMMPQLRELFADDQP